MSSEERKKILQMVAEGKITAEGAAGLMRALDDDGEPGANHADESAEPEVEVLPGPASSSHEDDASSGVSFHSSSSASLAV